MTTAARLDELKTQALLSTLWVVTLLNVVFRDIHEFVRPGFLEEVMTGSLNGTELTPELFLLGGVIVQVPIMMILLARVLPRSINRWAHLIAAPLMMLIVVTGRPADLDDYFHAGVELALLAVLFSLAWRWREAERRAQALKTPAELGS